MAVNACFGGNLLKLKSFIVSFLSFVLTTGGLFLIGHVFTITWLMFHYEYTNNAKEFSISTGSFVPLIIGLIVCFFAEKIYIYKCDRSSIDYTK